MREMKNVYKILVGNHERISGGGRMNQTVLDEIRCGRWAQDPFVASFVNGR
jgi:hypothetical protein